MADGAACVAHKACVRSFCTPPFVARRELEPAWLYSRDTPAYPEGIGSLLNWRKAAFIYADAARVPWFGRLVNSHDGADYAPFFGFGDPLCVDAPSTAANSSAALVHTEPDRHFVTRMAGHGGALARICRAVEAGGGGDASAINGSSIIRDLRSGGGLILPVDQFRSGLSYCAYSARFRERFRRARARRKRVVKAADERWVCVHFRWGDVHTQSHLWYNKDRIHRGLHLGQLPALAAVARTVRRVIDRSDARAAGGAAGGERGHGGGGGGGAGASAHTKIHLFSEGAASEFTGFTAEVPEARLHLGGGGAQGTQDDLDRLSQCDVLIGGPHSQFTVLAAHLCDACVVIAANATTADHFRPTPPNGVPAHHQILDLPLDASALARAWGALRNASAGR